MFSLLLDLLRFPIQLVLSGSVLGSFFLQSMFSQFFRARFFEVPCWLSGFDQF